MLNPQRLYKYSLSLAIILVCLIIQALAPYSIELLRYQSIEVNNGQLWRIISANFCHSNWYHLGLNMLGLLLIDYFFSPYNSQKLRAFLLISCIILNVIFLHLFIPSMQYVGMSGALHGYILGNALVSFKKDKWINLAIIIVVFIKLFTELNWDINQNTAKLIEVDVAEEAHLFGAISGVIFFVFYFMFKLRKNKSKCPKQKDTFT